MSVSNGRTPFLLLAAFLLTRCTDDSAPIQGSETGVSSSSETGDETVTPTTGPAEPESTGTGDQPADTDEDTSSSTGGVEEPGSSSSSGEVLPVCGDGFLDEGEQCDDGFAANTVSGACLPDCTKASCGDGVVHEGVEDCDLGLGNSFDYGGCNSITCKWGPRCGDSKVDPPNEVCDPGDPNGQGDGVAVCDDDCRFAGRIVFLSSVAFDGNLGGLAGADKLCRDLAGKFDEAHADTYRAWLSDAENSPQSRFSHGPEFDGVPYVLRNGVQIAADFTDLTTNGPWPGIELTDTGEMLTLEHVWSNTGVDGNPLTEVDHCNGWTANDLQAGRFGMNAVPAMSPDLDAWQTFGHWTHVDGNNCLYKLRLYCFEN